MVKASTLTAQVQGLLPELATVPPLSFQSETTALAGINLSTPQGLLDYQSKLSSITNNFGDALSSSGFSLDDLVSQFAPSIPGLSSAMFAKTVQILKYQVVQQRQSNLHRIVSLQKQRVR